MLDQEPWINKWSYRWYKNMQFAYGNHHLKWSRRYGVAVDSDFLTRDKRSINQRSHTNITREISEALTSLIYSATPKWEANPADDRVSQSTRMAEVCQSLLDAYVHTLEVHRDLRKAAASFVTYGCVGSEVGYDWSDGEVIQIPEYQKQRSPVWTTDLRPEQALGGLLSTTHQVMGSDGAPWMTNAWQPVSDQQGLPIEKNVTLGRPYIDWMTPFEYRREPGSSGMHTAKWIQRIRLIDYDDYMRRYGALSGKTKWFGSVEPENMSRVVQQFAMLHFLRLFQISPIVEDNWRDAGYRFSDYVRRKILVIEHWDRPNAEWPEGRRVIVTNGYCTHVTKPQFRTNKQGGWHPFSEAEWFSILPSTISTGPLHDVVEKNRQLNTTDSLIATALLRNFGSMLLTRTGSGLDPQRVTGTPGEIHEVNDPSTAAMWLHDNSPISPAITALREEFKQDTYDTSGAGDALRGQRTVGVTSGYAYRQAQEREEKRLTPARKEFEAIVGTTGEKLLACVKQNSIQLGADVIGYMKRNSAGKFTTQDITMFLATPLVYGVDVNVQAGSMEMESKATAQANLIELATKTPLGQRLAQDANVMDKFLEYFDAHKLRDFSAAHRERAKRENEVFADLLRLGPTGKAETMPVAFDKDDHDIHMNEHIDWLIRNDTELMTNGWLLEAITLHIEQHRIQKRVLAGELPAGTAEIVPQLSQFTRQPTLQGVIAEKQMQPPPQTPQAQPGAQQQGGGQQGQGGPRAPAGPKQPAPVGSGGPPQTATSTPSQNTPTGRSQMGR